MDKELQKRLVEKYPSFFIDKDKGPKETLICFGVECGNGWYNLLDTLIGEILKVSPNTKAMQIKEKWGTLRVYVVDANDAAYDLIDGAESDSEKICEVCGKEGSLRDKLGWVRTMCDEHLARYLDGENL
jgi:hypothetical protein